MIVQILCTYMMVKYSDLLGPIRNPKTWPQAKAPLVVEPF